MTDEHDPQEGLDFEKINAETHYEMFSVFARTQAVGRQAAEEALAEVLKATEGREFNIRGWYDVAGFRADADLMVWWHAPDFETLQDAYHALRRTELGETLLPVWSQMALHRAAEFKRSHIPAFLAGEAPGKNICVYPFVRDSEWYLMPEQQRSNLLREHGMMARPYPDVRANTVASFALGDYEWILAFECDELHRIVDLMRDLRAAGARKHMREEQPFFTGRRLELADIVASWGEPREGSGCGC